VPIETQDGKQIGEIASRTLSVELQAPIAFAYLDAVHRTPGTQLVFKGRDGMGLLKARVVLLPFYAAPDVKARVAYLHDRAIRSFSKHQDEQATALLEEALRLDPTYRDAYEALGVILGRSERYHEAIDLFKRLEEIAPNEPMVHTNLSLFYMRLGDKDAAEKEKTKATVKQFGKFADEAAAKRQADEERQVRMAEARRKQTMFLEVLEIDPEDPIALFGLGNVHLTLEAPAEAAPYLEKALSAQRDNSPVYLTYGKVLEQLGRREEAIEIYRQGMAVASKKGDLMPLKEMEHRLLLMGVEH
jgi:Flp pilus assembly protein TadD